MNKLCTNCKIGTYRSRFRHITSIKECPLCNNLISHEEWLQLPIIEGKTMRKAVLTLDQEEITKIVVEHLKLEGFKLTDEPRVSVSKGTEHGAAYQEVTMKVPYIVKV